MLYHYHNTDIYIMNYNDNITHHYKYLLILSEWHSLISNAPSVFPGLLCLDVQAMTQAGI